MPGTAPPAPAAVEVVTQVVYYLSLSVPLGMGLTVGGAFAVPDGPVSRGGVRSLGGVPAAVLVMLGLVLHLRATTHVTGLALVQSLALALVACGLVAMRWTNSRALARGVAAVALVAAALPVIPLQYSNLSRVASNALTAVHVIGAVTWVGGLVVLAATAVALRRSRTRDQDSRVADDWARFGNGSVWWR